MVVYESLGQRGDEILDELAGRGTGLLELSKAGS
jgi:hypothetical protein